MKATSEIKKVIAPELKEFNIRFKQMLKSDIALLNIVTNYLLKRKGKQIRPALVFLSAKLFGEISQSAYTAASLIELLHTATLVHDDVAHDGNVRRGFLSINALWKSKLVVLLGDYLLSRGLLIAVEYKQYGLLEIVSEAVKEISEGELLQIRNMRKLSITEQEYFEIIEKKSATLYASCTASGAKCANQDYATICKMQEFGLSLGFACRIKDDLLGFERTSFTRYPKGNGIKELIFTLPFIASLDKADKGCKKKVMDLIDKNTSTRNTYKEIIKFVQEHNGIAYSKIKLKEYHDKALDILCTFPDNEVRNSLEYLVKFNLERKK